MYEKQLFVVQQKIINIVKAASEDPKAAAVSLIALKKEVQSFAGESSAEYYQAATVIQEAIGDVWAKAKQQAEAEKAYIEMAQLSGKLYELDKEKYDYRLGFSFYKRASFYRSTLQCNVLNIAPKVLDEKQQKLFDITEKLYQNALACTMENAKKGQLRCIELHSLCFSELLVLYGAVGKYEQAVGCGKDGIRLDKAIFDKLDDKAHAFRLANRMNALATVYTFMKNVQLVSETLEDSIFVLEEHEQDDPISFGVMLGRNYLTLAGCYSQIEESKAEAEEAYQKGLRYMVETNKSADNKMIGDVITSYMIVGDHYRRQQNEVLSKVHYRRAMELASEAYEKTKDVKYEGVIKRLKAVI